jgi:hypothetical protein
MKLSVAWYLHVSIYDYIYGYLQLFVRASALLVATMVRGFIQGVAVTRNQVAALYIRVSDIYT